MIVVLMRMSNQTRMKRFLSEEEKVTKRKRVSRIATKAHRKLP